MKDVFVKIGISSVCEMINNKKTVLPKQNGFFLLRTIF